MKMLRLFRRPATVVAPVIVLVVFLAPGATAARTPTGAWLDEGMFCAPTCIPDYPADTAFYLRHGWGHDPKLSALYGFTLEVDGVPTAASFTQTQAFAPPLSLFTFWYFDFPDGLPAGLHTFHGVWTEPCSAAVGQGIQPGPCASPTQTVVAIDETGTVLFTP